MYGVALTVTACLRAGTRVDVAWIVDPGSFATSDPTEAIAITPGGGRTGTLLGGALDATLADLAARRSTHARVVDVSVSDVDALIAGLPSGGSSRCLLAPATELPGDLWPLLLQREPVCMVMRLGDDGTTVTDTSLFTAATIDKAGEAARELFAAATSAATLADRAVVCTWWPVPHLVIAGGGPIADALQVAVIPLGWRVTTAPDPDTAVGLVAGLSRIDSVVVVQHDVEAAGRVLAAALGGAVGYIGSVGSQRMQQLRADWLAYRGVTDLTRVHGPAGIPIGARTSAESAIAILAEAVQSTHA